MALRLHRLEHGQIDGREALTVPEPYQAGREEHLRDAGAMTSAQLRQRRHVRADECKAAAQGLSRRLVVQPDRSQLLRLVEIRVREMLQPAPMLSGFDLGDVVAQMRPVLDLDGPFARSVAPAVAHVFGGARFADLPALRAVAPGPPRQKRGSGAALFSLPGAGRVRPFAARMYVVPHEELRP